MSFVNVQEDTGPPNDGGGPDPKAGTATTANNTPTAEQVASNGNGPTPPLPALDDVGETARAVAW